MEFGVRTVPFSGEGGEGRGRSFSAACLIPSVYTRFCFLCATSEGGGRVEGL
jgi:hypothetical protein